MSIPFDADRITKSLSSLREFQLPDQVTIQGLRSNPRGLKKFLEELHNARDYLSRFEKALDDILIPDHVFDMANPATVGEVVVYKLEQQPKERLTAIRPFYGSGVYALYYHDGLPAYEAITGTDCPIYVGSAGPETPNAASVKQQGTKLYDRIMEHLNKSIGRSSTLRVEDFFCRYLVVQSGLEKAAEDFLIRDYSPVWNKETKVCSGIGKHGDQNRKELSDWDVMHGGRKWAEGQSSLSGKTAALVEGKIIAHFQRLLSEKRTKWERIFNPAWLARQTSPSGPSPAI